MNIDLPILISIISVLIAAISSAITIRNYRREQLNQKLQAEKWNKEYFTDLLKWSDESILLLSEAFHLCELDPQKNGDGKFSDARYLLRIRLSAQIDKGRWFFPNYDVEYGEHKDSAYRGFRHEVLDALVHAYKAVTNLNCVDGSQNIAQQSTIQAAQRQFTSEIQKVLDPRKRDSEFKKLTHLIKSS